MTNPTSVCSRAGLVAAGLLALIVTGPAAADPYDFDVRQGPDEMIITVNDFRQFHSLLTNTGDNPEAYAMDVTFDAPARWTFGVCFGDACYPPSQTSFRVPETGTLAPGESMAFDFDVFALEVKGEATCTVKFAAETDPAVSRTYTFHVRTPAEGRALLFSAGHGVMHAPVDGYVQFHPVLYNAGTVADSYTMTVARDIPTNWAAMFCVDDVCYPPDQDSIQLPVGGGTYAGGAMEPIDIDFAPLLDAGRGSMTVTITSDSDPTIMSAATYTVTTGSVVAVENAPALDLVGAVSAAPNPFNPRTEIRFRVGGDEPRDAVLEVFAVDGRRVRTFAARRLEPGVHGVVWNGDTDAGRPAATGTYLVRVTVGGMQRSAKMTLSK